MGRKRQRHIIVAGGGIIGLATANKLSAEGFLVTLCEKGSLHGATSANSHCIIHGGLRYLQQFHFSRVWRSLRAKNICLEQYQDCVVPLKCFLPVPERGIKRSPILGLAGALYGAVSTLFGFPTEWSGICSAEEVKSVSKYFADLPAKKSFYWSDAWLQDPSRMSDKLRGEFEESGGTLRTECRIEQVKRTEEGFSVQTGKGQTMTCDGFVSAVGPWHSSITLPNSHRWPISNGWAKAFNLLLSREVVDRVAVGITASGGEVLFFSPRGDGKCAIGTWYSVFEGSLEDLHVSEDEMEGALQEVNSASGTRTPLELSDVEAVEVGVLPMKGVRGEKPILYGEEVVEKHDGVVSILSTKYTTFPVVAEEVMNYFSEIFP